MNVSTDQLRGTGGAQEESMDIGQRTKTLKKKKTDKI